VYEEEMILVKSKKIVRRRQIHACSAWKKKNVWHACHAAIWLRVSHAVILFGPVQFVVVALTLLYEYIFEMLVDKRFVQIERYLLSIFLLLIK
jgi:hypothetical protein